MDEIWWVKDKVFLDKDKAKEYGKWNVRSANREYSPISFNYHIKEATLIEDNEAMIE